MESLEQGKSMRTELVSIKTDTVPLEGAYYQPEGQDTVGSVQLFHGNQMNFYVGAPRFLPPVLTGIGYACLAYNRRGHDVLSTRNSRDLEGGAFQTTAEAVADNVFAGDWLRAKGFGAPVCIGHSNGGMLAVCHTADHSDTPALVLLSAHCGGTAIAPECSKLGLWAGDNFDAVKHQAEELVAAGRGRDLMLLPGWWKVTTAESALDYIANVPDTLELAPRITCPVLFIRGDQEPRHVYPAEDFKEACAGPVEVRIIDDCGHFYSGREEVISDTVSGWLAGLDIFPEV